MRSVIIDLDPSGAPSPTSTSCASDLERALPDVISIIRKAPERIVACRSVRQEPPIRPSIIPKLAFYLRPKADISCIFVNPLDLWTISGGEQFHGPRSSQKLRSPRREAIPTGDDKAKANRRVERTCDCTFLHTIQQNRPGVTPENVDLPGRCIVLLGLSRGETPAELPDNSGGTSLHFRLKQNSRTFPLSSGTEEASPRDLRMAIKC